MVYCGKPSRGCQMCRTRRIKCDETKPTCNQCAKSRRQCPGYKDEFDLVFRNETQATERRARRANTKAQSLKLNRSASEAELIHKGHSPTDMVVAAAKPRQVASSLTGPPEEQATCHFISNWVLVPRQGSTRGYMDYLMPMLGMDKPDGHFKAAFEACAFAHLGNRVGTGQDFKNMALASYTKALASTHKALIDPELSKQDTTLAAILLLGLYENISAKKLGMLAWGSHIEGAIQLVKARGRNQLKTKTGLALFIAVRTQMIIHTLSSGQAPAMGVEWWITDAVKDESAAACQRLNIRVGELRAEVNRLLSTLVPCPENVELMLDMIRKCQGVDQELLAWSKDLPDYFTWKTVAWEDNIPNNDYSQAEAFPGRVDAYQDLWVASVWNMMRCSRIILASLTVRCAAWVCSPLDYRTTPEYASAARICVDNIADIIASVPYQLGWFSSRQELLDRANLSAFGCGEENAPKGLPGYLLTWPLTCVLGQDYASDSQRAWVKGRLTFIGSELGVSYAHMLTQLNLRIPSMLIQRDGLMAKPYPAGPNFEKLLSGNNRDISLDPAQLQRLVQSEQMKRRRIEVAAQARSVSSSVDAWMGRPQMQPESTIKDVNNQSDEVGFGWRIAS